MDGVPRRRPSGGVRAVRPIVVTLTLIVALSVSIGLLVFVLFSFGVFHHYHNPREDLPQAKDSNLVVNAGGDCGQFIPTEPQAQPRLIAYTGFYKVAVVRGSTTCGDAVTVFSDALHQVAVYDTEFRTAGGWNCTVADIHDAQPPARRGATCSDEATELVLMAVADANPR